MVFLGITLRQCVQEANICKANLLFVDFTHKAKAVKRPLCYVYVLTTSRVVEATFQQNCIGSVLDRTLACEGLLRPLFKKRTRPLSSTKHKKLLTAAQRLEDFFQGGHEEGVSSDND